jgi:hypothetical protein
MSEKTNRIIALVITLVLLVLFSILAITSTTIFEGADNIAHYNVSHFSFKHPELFLYHWGKPLFTILSSPFAQFGFIGIKLFNVLVGIATAYFAYRYLHSQKVEMPYAVMPFVVFVPMYFMMMQSGLTEVLCSFIFVLAAFCFVDKRYILSAIVISFVPISRTDAIIAIPIYAVAFLWFRQYKALPFLVTGVVIFSLIGWFQYHDLLWLINQNPYKGVGDLYGKGSLFHFVDEMPYAYGWPLIILTLLGTLGIVFWFFWRKARIKEPVTADFFMLFLPTLAMLAAHSYVWWKGMGNSAGLTRVLTAVMPLASIMAFKGLNEITSRILFKWLKWILLLIALYFIVRLPFNRYPQPAKLHTADLMMSRTADWIKSQGLQDRSIYYYDPEVAFFNNRDPWNHEKGRQIIRDNNVNENLFEEGSLIIWDSHFGQHEGRTPVSNLLEKRKLKLIKILLPKPAFTVFGHEYSVYVFMKDKTHEPHDNFQIEKELRNNILNLQE